MLPISYFLQRTRHSRRILDSDSETDDNEESVMSTEKMVDSPALSTSNDDGNLNAEKPVIGATVRLFCPCFDYQVLT
jgi:hypothetical protein